jgi:hypothetical protein
MKPLPVILISFDIPPSVSVVFGMGHIQETCIAARRHSMRSFSGTSMKKVDLPGQDVTVNQIVQADRIEHIPKFCTGAATTPNVLSIYGN